MKDYLRSHLGSKPDIVELPRKVYVGKKELQEWEGCFLDGDVLYLCEAKHFIFSEDIIMNIRESVSRNL